MLTPFRNLLRNSIPAAFTPASVLSLLAFAALAFLRAHDSRGRDS